MDLQKFALRLLVLLLITTTVVFVAEALWDFHNAINPTTGKPLQFSDLEVTAQMVRTVASPFARAYNNILALLLTFISLAIPLTANLYTPKLVEIFIRDRLNLFVLCFASVLAAHSLFAIALSFDVWTPQMPFWIDGVGAILGWLLLMPYYFYVLSFIDPLTIIKRIHLSLMHELEVVSQKRHPIPVMQHRVNQRIINLGSMLQRSVDRADRDVAFDAIKAHTLDLARIRAMKPRLPDAFFKVNTNLMVGMSSDATDMLSRDRIWMEHRIAAQLVLAFRTALSKMPEGVSALVYAVKVAAHEEAVLRNDAVFHLLVRVLNSFTRESIKKKENAPVYNVVYNYKTLIRRLIKDRPEFAVDLARHLRYYSEFARSNGLDFIYDLISYELADVAEIAFARGLDPVGVALVDAVLEFEGVDKSIGLVKSRAILAGYLLESKQQREADRIIDSLRSTPTELLVQSAEGVLMTLEPVFWELTDRGYNIDYVKPERRESVRNVFRQLGVDIHPA